MVIVIPPPLLVSLHYLGKHKPHKFGLFSHAAYVLHTLNLPHSFTNFNNFWQKIAVVFELSPAYLIYHVHLLLLP